MPEIGRSDIETSSRLHSTIRGVLWTVEHGARGGDELNLIEKGKNYGWAVSTYGEEYSGEPIAGAVTQRRLRAACYYWDPR
jgi:glucose/arabinose dehydrogenase